MDADSSQVNAEPLIEADFGGNGGRVTFHSIQEAREWAEREHRQWQNFWTRIEVGSFVPNVLDRQVELPTKIRDVLNEAEQAEGSDQSKALQEIEDLFERYADYGSLYSASPLGTRLLDSGRHRHGFVKVGAWRALLEYLRKTSSIRGKQTISKPP